MTRGSVKLGVYAAVVGAGMLGGFGVSACGPGGELSPGSYYCAADTDCPSGQFCNEVSGYCGSTHVSVGQTSDDAGSSDSSSFQGDGGHDWDGGRRHHDGGFPGEDAGPAGNTAYICQPCTSSSDCGGEGNACLGLSGGDFCGSACTVESDCPADDTCYTVSGQGSFCIPQSMKCPTTDHADAGTHVDAGTPHVDAGTPHVDAGPAMCTTDTWSNFASNFFTTNCDYCHSHDFGESISNVQAEQSTIVDYISSGRMPENTTLPAATKTRILKWLNCDDPQ